MKRRAVARNLIAGVAVASLQSRAAPAKPVDVGMITAAGGLHLDMYFESLAAAEEIGAVFLSDPSEKSVALARKLLRDKLRGTYRDARAMLRNAPALAVVSMSPGSAPAAIGAALDAGCHVLSEKPGCLDSADFARVSAKARATNRHLLLALANRSDPAMIAARRLVAEGKIGRVFGVEACIVADQTRLRQPGYGDDWRAHQAQAGGGHLIWLGIHWIDLARFITGSAVQSVSAFTANVGKNPYDVEDSAVVTMQFDNGALGTLTSAYYLDRGYDAHVKVWGSQGWLLIDRRAGYELTLYSAGDAAPQVRRVQTPRLDGTVYTAFLRAVARACQGLAPPPLTGEESLAALQTVFACYRAAGTGRAQRVG
jgi:predicted dehydrogenase